MLGSLRWKGVVRTKLEHCTPVGLVLKRACTRRSLSLSLSLLFSFVLPCSPAVYSRLALQPYNVKKF